MMKIYGLPEYAKDYKFVVYTEDDGDCWFYGAYADWNKAWNVADSINGKVAASDTVEEG